MAIEIIKGKKCIIIQNMDEADRICQLSDTEKPDPNNLPKEFEIYRLGAEEDSNWHYFYKYTPYYSKIGWDTLEEAKIFFLLQEI